MPRAAIRFPNSRRLIRPATRALQRSLALLLIVRASPYRFRAAWHWLDEAPRRLLVGDQRGHKAARQDRANVFRLARAAGDRDDLAPLHFAWRQGDDALVQFCRDFPASLVEKPAE